MAEAVGFEPTCPCGQLHFECSSLQPLRYASVYKYLLLGTNHMISSRSRYDHFDTSPYMTASLLLRMEKSLVYYDTTSWKRQGETFRFLVVKKVHRSGLPLRWTDRANRFVLIHTHSSKRISYPASPMPLCRARCCRLALPTLAPAQDAQDSPAADHQHPCP